MADKQAIYNQIIQKVFEDRFKRGAVRVSFLRKDMEEAARNLSLKVPSNLGDVPYTFRFRKPLPNSVREKAPKNEDWVIRITGRGRYAFEPVKQAWFVPDHTLEVTKVPDATPAIIERYALNDEQAVLAILRYNRLIDIFSGITCYSLQSHLRTTVYLESTLGNVQKPQIETDELYLGIDKWGAHHLIPVQAKGGTDQLSVVQIEQDFALCRKQAFKNLTPLPVGAQFIGDKTDRLIALFQFTQDPSTLEVTVAREEHYRLVPSSEISDRELIDYADRSLR